MNNLIREIKFATASLQKARGFVVTVLLTLGITLGSLVSILALNHLINLQPLPYDDHEQLHLVKGVFLNNNVAVMKNVNSYASARALYNLDEYFEDAAMMTYETLELQSGQRLLVTGTFVTPEFFELLSVPMAIGRPLGESEKYNAYHPVAVISYHTWQDQFQGRQDILQHSIDLNDRSYSIVGVTAKQFNEPQFFSGEFNGTQVWLPWDYHAGSEKARQSWTSLTPRTNVIAKLSQGLTTSQGEQAVGIELNRLFTSSVAPPGRKIPYAMNVELASFEQVIVGDSRKTAFLLLAGALSLLLIACSNVVNLMLSRTAQKHRQLTIRATLGANPKHLFTSIFAENLLLMTGVFIIAIGIAAVGFDVLRELASDKLPRLGELTLTPLTVLAALLISLTMAAIFSLLSASMIKYKTLQTSLQSSGKGSGLQVSAKIRSLLTASQVALACLLVVANLSILKQATDVIYQGLGFETEELSYISINYQGKTLSGEERDQLTRDITATLQQVPSIENVASTTSEPTRPGNGGTATKNFGDDANTNMMMFFTSEDYFEVLQQSLVAGRTYNQAEVNENAQVAVITQSLADALYPQQNALGMNIVHNNNDVPYNIIGIVEDLTLPPLANALGGEAMNKQHLYMPGFSVQGTSEFRFMLKAKPEQLLSKTVIQSALERLDPGIKVWNMQSMNDRRDEMVHREVSTAQISLTLTIISLLLAGIGIYGVLNYGTQLRRYELGVRMSLGASPMAIVSGIMQDSLKPIILGFVVAIVLGVAAYSVAKQHIAELLHINVLELGATATLIVITALLAAWLPTIPIVKEWPVKSLRVD